MRLDFEVASSDWPISPQFSIFVPTENIRKPQVFLSETFSFLSDIITLDYGVILNQ